MFSETSATSPGLKARILGYLLQGSWKLTELDMLFLLQNRFLRRTQELNRFEHFVAHQATLGQNTSKLGRWMITRRIATAPVRIVPQPTGSQCWSSTRVGSISLILPLSLV